MKLICIGTMWENWGDAPHCGDMCYPDGVRESPHNGKFYQYYHFPNYGRKGMFGFRVEQFAIVSDIDETELVNQQCIIETY